MEDQSLILLKSKISTLEFLIDNLNSIKEAKDIIEKDIKTFETEIHGLIGIHNGDILMVKDRVYKFHSVSSFDNDDKSFGCRVFPANSSAISGYSSTTDHLRIDVLNPNFKILKRASDEE